MMMKGADHVVKTVMKVTAVISYTDAGAPLVSVKALFYILFVSKCCF